MPWKIVDGRIAFNINNQNIFPTVQEISELYRGQVTDNELLSAKTTPITSLPIRFSGLGAYIKIVFSMNSDGINIDLYATEGKSEIKIPYVNNDLPDGMVINGVWYNLLPCYNAVSEALKYSEIHASGHITVMQYAKLKKELSNAIELIDSAENLLKTQNISNHPADIPVKLKAKLYPYQEKGYQLMKFMADQKCGCILGDEMGLGKTLQIITLILDRKKQNFGSSLVIAPVSLLENWRREFNKFSDGVKVYIHQGPNRTGYYEDLKYFDVVIISYGTAVLDIAMLQMIEWDLVVADEAQNIKNPEAQRSKVLKTIPKNLAIAVTGTPFENHVTDLWSIMDFIFPGFLGTLFQFQKEYSDNLGGAKKLQPLITPFIIRRKVSEVAQDLPERIDIPQILTFCENEATQYEKLRLSIIEEYANKNYEFAMLIKLRMFCTHPRIVGLGTNADPKDESSKYERLCEILAEIIAIGEKTILFTSYLKMFDIICSDIPKRFGISVMTINGSTPAEKRQLIIDDFSYCTKPSLLVLHPIVAPGLNITAANRVIHYNLEWNPALEDQCSARAYRRGQERTVFIYRMYYKNSVEEIINSCVEKKREILSSTIIGVNAEKPNNEDIIKALMISPKTANQ